MTAKKQGAKTPKRDTKGLLDSVDYVFNEDGAIDWRAMIKDQYLVPNREKTSVTDISKLKDNMIKMIVVFD